MQQLNERQVRLFARTIMPELYAMQARQDKRKKGLTGGVEELSEAEVFDFLIHAIEAGESGAADASGERPVS